jgi:PKD repeat protein
MRFNFFLTILTAFVFCGKLSAQADFIADNTAGCAPFTVKFSLDPATVDTNILSSVEWDFGNGDPKVISFNPPTVVYSSPGNYTVSIVIDGDVLNPITKTDYIAVHSKVLADFDFQPVEEPYTYEFLPINPINDASATYFYRWTYYDENLLIRNVTYIENDQITTADTFAFPDTGIYRVALNIRDSYGCNDSTSQLIQIKIAEDSNTTDTAEFVVANVFAPESEDFFIINPEDPAVALSFKVFSRTGVIVYSTEAQIVYWDGKTNSGRDLDTGVYFYTLEALQGDTNNYYSKRGFIHLFR